MVNRFHHIIHNIHLIIYYFFIVIVIFIDLYFYLTFFTFLIMSYLINDYVII